MTPETQDQPANVGKPDTQGRFVCDDLLGAADHDAMVESRLLAILQEAIGSHWHDDTTAEPLTNGEHRWYNQGLQDALNELGGIWKKLKDDRALDTPPVDNAHVAPGCEQFDTPNAPHEPPQGARE